MAAESHPESSHQQSLRKSSAEHSASPDSLEFLQHLRQMTRPVTLHNRLLVAVLLTVVAVTGCRRRAAEVSEYNDPHPLPEDPFVVDAPSIGKHGGRFVIAQTGNPRTFNEIGRAHV